eukprot:CAMPEP_0168415384 /NCGR_PEP_ID=MMETSP0228-20121227/30206_1 /TAXON_ID=133427 /ORGANISM="Protoceratium reticulatum, Strain CCCM 535 (=CCMP 1889)" /LENGTH=70 /DNA_ID=CAMNT_0008429195 /DNA_START=136 /DNA_END=347 /DNA_ORIENTATION=-
MPIHVDASASVPLAEELRPAGQQDVKELPAVPVAGQAGTSPVLACNGKKGPAQGRGQPRSHAQQAVHAHA